MGNFRNISIQTQFAKVIDMSYKTRLEKFIVNHKLINNCQHGFCPGKSTTSAVAELCEHIYESLNLKKASIALYLDLSRAFDTVDHRLLLEKLERIGVRGVANQWIASYLQNRKQIVTIGKNRSEEKTINVGVPQGSILAPILFIIFINDLPSNINDTTIMYADDTNIFISGESLEEVSQRAGNVVQYVHNWCSDNGLLLNAEKTQFMSFFPKNKSNDHSSLIRINHKSIQQVQSSKFLGIFIDQKMTWEDHVNHLLSKLSTTCFVIKQLKNTVSINILKLAYFGLAQSTLNYCLMFWGNSSYMNKAFLIQKRIVRCMVGAHSQTSCKPLFKQLKILTLPCLYILQATLYIHKHEQELKKYSSFHNYRTRNKDNIYPPFSRLSVGQDCHLYQGIRFYNRCRVLFGSAQSDNNNCKSFKNFVTEYLLNNAFYSIEEFIM